LIESASWRLTGRFSRKVGSQRELEIGPKAAEGRSETRVKDRLAGGARDATPRSRRLGSSGRAGKLIGGASRSLAGRQRRRDATVDELEVEFKGQAERSVEDASRRQDREAEPEMQQPESDVWFARQG
jgi:hypothetical protein